MAKLKAVVLNKLGVEGLTNVKIRLTHDGKSREIATPYYIPYPAMDKDGTIKDSYPNAPKLNKVLRELIHEYYGIIDDIGPSVRYMSINSLLSRLRNKEIAKSFTQYTQGRIKELRQENRMSYAESYEVMLAHLERFKGEVSFRNIDAKFLEGFRIYLKVRGAKTNTIRIYLNNIRAIFNQAINSEIISLPSPFPKFKVRSEKSPKRSLGIDDIRKLMTGQYPVAQQRSVDLFMLIMYLNGINLKDLLYFKPKEYENGRIKLNRAKTGEPLDIKVFPEAKAIIDKWRGEKYLLRFLDKDDSYEFYKNFLKETNKRLRKAFSGRISTYYARHSLASIMAELKFPIETISWTLGHTLPGSPMTGIYIKFNMQKVDEAMERVISCLTTQTVEKKEDSVISIAR